MAFRVYTVCEFLKGAPAHFRGTRFQLNRSMIVASAITVGTKRDRHRRREKGYGKTAIRGPIPYSRMPLVFSMVGFSPRLSV